ncbi:hypothetical protein CCR75_008526 [Bremia lactucae]|uniref:Integrase catalytic domain-containing protein n=1 Tax=Bremia lactucae TaxID=4779 RepID=A0A976FHX4_BRELC|nr:hypothetical protein CCR75_008526 [Bremia lactucae]
MWVSDNGSYFKNSFEENLRDRRRVLHTFVPVYTPWLNGTVERLNCDVLQVMQSYHWGGRGLIELFNAASTDPLDTALLPRNVQTKGKLMHIDLVAVDEKLEAFRVNAVYIEK